MSIEFGIDAAIRRASASTNGSPATIRRFWLAAIGCTRIFEVSSVVPLAARYRNRSTNSSMRVHFPDSKRRKLSITSCQKGTYKSVLIQFQSTAVGRQAAEFVMLLTNREA